MTITTGAKLPEATLYRMGNNGPETVELSDLIKGRKVVLFGLPGAFTGTCTTAHLPSFMRTKAQFEAKGVEEIICVSVNDPFVMKAWAEATGAEAAGLTLVADPAADFIKAIGMEFSAPPAGFYDRSKRFALCAEDGLVTVMSDEEKPGMCEMSTGEALLEKM